MNPRRRRIRRLARAARCTTFSYSSGRVSLKYRCAKCGAHGVKLWRDYQTFLSHIVLRCAGCAMKAQSKNGTVDDDWFRVERHGKVEFKTDQIGWLVPAVPTEDGKTFWGYTSVPKDGVNWWRQLPTALAKR